MRRAGGGHAAEHPPQLDAQERVQADRRLIEDEQLGLAEQQVSRHEVIIQ
jgi:hypothetical protein